MCKVVMFSDGLHVILLINHAHTLNYIFLFSPYSLKCNGACFMYRDIDPVLIVGGRDQFICMYIYNIYIVYYIPCSNSPLGYIIKPV